MKMKMKTLGCLLVCLAFMSISSHAQNEQTFLRSSIYTVLVKSDIENAKLDREIEDPNLITSMVAGFKDTKNALASMNPFKKSKSEDAAEEKAEEKAETPAPTTIRSKVPQTMFPMIPIPNQFNDHNLADRVIDLDPLAACFSQEEMEAAAASFEEKKSKGKKLLSGIGKGAASMLGGGSDGSPTSALFNIDTISSQIPAALNKYFTENNTAAKLVAKWFDYNESKNPKWDTDLISDRGLYSATAQEAAKAQAQGSTALLLGKGFDLIDKTFVIAINLRFRSNQAIMAEAQMIADAVGAQFGAYGMLASQVAGAATSLAVGKGYSVQANSFLYKLEWDDEICKKFADNIFDKNASLDDLINSGMCKLVPMGKVKESARVRQSLTNSRSEEELVRIATVQAIDKAISKLQEKVEDFRTFTTISGMGENGVVYAKIGTKEGLEKDDEYDILEAQEDPETGRMSYKSVGTVKFMKDQIWENREGIAEDINNISADEAKDMGYNLDAVKLGATAFKGAKKGADYTGYLLRLKKKK